MKPLLILLFVSCGVILSAQDSSHYRKVVDPVIDNKNFYILDEPPQYPGGDEAMMTFIRANLNYPSIPQSESEIRTRLVIGFTVNKDGSLSDIRVIRSMYPAFDTAGIEVVKKFPKFKPGMQHGVPVSASFMLPIQFELSDH